VISKFKLIFIALGMAIVLACPALAEPPQIDTVGGNGSITQTQDPSTQTTNFNVSGHVIGQASQADILPGETWNIHFADPADTFLLRVLDPSGTRIFGDLNIFYGSFVLVNPHGIDIGTSGRVHLDHAAFIASTLDIRSSDLVSGKYSFGGSGHTAVSNQGLIRTTGPGSVVLLGPAVDNAGRIEAPLGKVALASGDAVTVTLDANGLIAVDVAEPVSQKVFDMQGHEIKTQVSNTGAILADGGVVLVDARSLDNIFDRSVNLQGLVRANKAVEGDDGIIRIVASDEVVNTGTLEVASGTLYLISDGLIKTSGYLIAEWLVEAGFSFELGGVVQVGTASIINIDGAVHLGTGSYSGIYEDAGDIIVDAGAQVTLTGQTVFWADSDPMTQAHDGNGIFSMDSGSAIMGGGQDLTVYSAGRDSGGAQATSNLSDISGVNTLTLNSSPTGESPVYRVAGTVDAGGQTVNINGNLLLSPGGTLTGAAAIYITGNWTNNGGTFVPGTGTVNFCSFTSDQSINGTASTQTFYDMVVAKGTKTLSVGGSTTTLFIHDLMLHSGTFATGVAAAVNILGNVLFTPLGEASFNGLSIDADTFTVSDVAFMIGDTARTYYPISDAILDAMIASGKMKTLIVGIPYDQNGYNWLGSYWGGSVPVGSDRINMVDNNYIAYITHVKERIAAAGSDMRFIIEFGNEYNLHPEWFGGNVQNWFNALTVATNNVHNAFGSSMLVSTVLGDIPGDFQSVILTGVDLVGMNTYRGLGNMASLLEQWNQVCAATGRTTPFYVSETGYSSWVGDGGEALQNVNVPLLWDELWRLGIGTVFMTFEDNMRKEGSLSAQDGREDYWGWLRQDQTHKAVYDTMSGVWTPPEFQAGSTQINVSGDWINNGGTYISENDPGFNFLQDVFLPIPSWHVLDIRALTTNLSMPFETHILMQLLSTTLIHDETIPFIGVK